MNSNSSLQTRVTSGNTFLMNSTMINNCLGQASSWPESQRSLSPTEAWERIIWVSHHDRWWPAICFDDYCQVLLHLAPKIKPDLKTKMLTAVRQHQGHQIPMAQLLGCDDNDGFVCVKPLSNVNTRPFWQPGTCHWWPNNSPADDGEYSSQLARARQLVEEMFHARAIVEPITSSKHDISGGVSSEPQLADDHALQSQQVVLEQVYQQQEPQLTIRRSASEHKNELLSRDVTCLNSQQYNDTHFEQEVSKKKQQHQQNWDPIKVQERLSSREPLQVTSFPNGKSTYNTALSNPANTVIEPDNSWEQVWVKLGGIGWTKRKNLYGNYIYFKPGTNVAIGKLGEDYYDCIGETQEWVRQHYGWKGCSQRNKPAAINVTSTKENRFISTPVAPESRFSHSSSSSRSVELETIPTNHAKKTVTLMAPEVRSSYTLQSSTQLQQQEVEHRLDIDYYALTDVLQVPKKREGWEAAKADHQSNVLGVYDDRNQSGCWNEPFGVDFCRLDDSAETDVSHKRGGRGCKCLDIAEIWKARTLLFAAAALYGTSFSFVKLLGDVMPVPISATVRFGLAALVTLPWLIRSNPKVSGLGTNSNIITAVAIGAITNGHFHATEFVWWDEIASLTSGYLQPEQQAAFAAILAGIEVGIWTSIGFIAQAVGLETVAATKSAFLCSLAVVIVPILNIFSGKSMLYKQVIGILLAVIGVAFLELGAIDTASEEGVWGSFTFGDAASSIQPLAFGLGFWRTEEAVSRYPLQAGRLTAAQMTAIFVACSGYWALSCGMAHTSCVSTAELMGWLTNPLLVITLFWTGAVTIALTTYMEAVAMKTLSAAEATLIFSTEPLWGAACAAIIMGEHLGLDDALGAALILMGCIFSQLGWGGIKALVFPPPEKETVDPSLFVEPASMQLV